MVFQSQYSARPSWEKHGCYDADVEEGAREKKKKRIWFCAYRLFITCRLLYENYVEKKIENVAVLWLLQSLRSLPSTDWWWILMMNNFTLMTQKAAMMHYHSCLMYSSWTTGLQPTFSHILFLSGTILLPNPSQYPENINTQPFFSNRCWCTDLVFFFVCFLRFVFSQPPN